MVYAYFRLLTEIRGSKLDIFEHLLKRILIMRKHHINTNILLMNILTFSKYP